MSQDTNETVLGRRGQLSADELALWHAMKKISATTTSLMKGEIGPGVSGADYSILSRLDELGGSTKMLGQSRLLASLGWDKSRLSHQLTRMEERGLVRRSRNGKETDVILLPAGDRLLATARPEHAEIIREYLSRLTPAEAEVIVSLAARL